MSAPSGHSPLGASSAERWLNCGGSVGLLKRLRMPTTDEPEYQREGTAAHEIAALGLEKNQDAWEFIGTKASNDVEITAEASIAVQTYLDIIRGLMDEGAELGVEYRFHRPDIHEAFYGTTDAYVWHPREALLDVADYKNGVGIAVDVVGNPQIMYYAYGLLNRFPDCRSVRLHIIQPRGFHPDGVHRVWEITVEELCEWAETVLIPAMEDIDMNGDLLAGEWCRFCPAKLICPVLVGAFGALMKADPKEVVNISNGSLGVQYRAIKGVKLYIKALEDTVFDRLSHGQEIEGTKLVAKRANRVWKDGAEAALKAAGLDVYTKPELKTPPAVEELGVDAKKLVGEWAYTPQTGLTVALATDKAPAVKVKKTAETFAGALAGAAE